MYDTVRLHVWRFQEVVYRLKEPAIEPKAAQRKRSEGNLAGLASNGLGYCSLAM